MMNKEQTIKKIMEEYEKHGIQREVAEIVYDMAIQKDVPRETIYQGMRFIFNQKLGLDWTEPITKVGDNFVEHAMNVKREENPTATEDVLVRNFKEEIEDNFDWSELSAVTASIGGTIFADGLTSSIKDASERFVRNNA
ncbi:MAG: hypothetical protein IKW30_04460 [Lachnospiraceae bacterium]|nr:hypothetical protein [Lachnospiraceae bacterium]